MRRFRQASRLRANRLHRQAFTLIELLVVILIVLIITTVTVVSVNFSTNADRMRAGARQMQSLIGGARDRAIYAKEIRGLRLLLDPNDKHAVSAVQYIGSPERDTGTLTFNPAAAPTGTGDATGYTVVGNGTRWQSLKRRGFLRIGSRIQIPRDTGTWYTVANIHSTYEQLGLNRPNRDLANTTAQVNFALELAPGILGDSQPVQFPSGVVIDLDGSQVPVAWRPSGPTLSYPTQMDILFTPRGTVVGDCASLGMIHLHFADAGDVVKWNGPSTPNNPGTNGRNSSYYFSALLPLVPADDPTIATPVVARDRILVTLTSRTGNAAVHHVNVTNVATLPLPNPPYTSYTSTNFDRQKIADDPFLFAETGEVANK